MVNSTGSSDEPALSTTADPQPIGSQPNGYPSMPGTVKHVSPHGWGFITDVNGVDRFFHCTKVIGGTDAFARLVAGMKVEFDPVKSPRGPRAVNVQPWTGAR